MAQAKARVQMLDFGGLTVIEYDGAYYVGRADKWTRVEGSAASPIYTANRDATLAQVFERAEQEAAMLPVSKMIFEGIAALQKAKS